MILRYDRAADRLLYGEVSFGKGDTVAELKAAFGAAAVETPGPPGWLFLKVDEATLTLTFQHGRLQGGSFVADVPAGTDWDALAEVSRATHEAIMLEQFGTLRFQSPTLLVYPFCHPRDGIETITFEVR